MPKKKSSQPLFDAANEAWDAGNVKEAFQLFMKAAAAGEVYALTSIGYFFDNGISVPKSKNKALYWYKKALYYGDNDLAPNNIGTVYRDLGNFERARFWFLKAIKNGDLDAAFELGKLYLERGNKNLAVKYLRLASKRSKFCTVATNEDAQALLRKITKR
jgi:TPR repeat protein